MTIRYFIAFLVFPLLFVFVPGVSAEDSGIPVVDYVLQEGSTFQEGCFDPCDCPLQEPQAMAGTFKLVFYPFEGPLWTVAVEQVQWTVPSMGAEITGAGSYVRAGHMHQLRLELSIAGGPPTLFDSGWVEGGGGYPAIDVVVSMNQLYCYDIALHILAAPVAPRPTLAVDELTLSWTPLPGDPVYDVVCGDLMTLRETGDFGAATDLCLADDTGATLLSYSLAAAAGQGLFFLVRRQGGTYDADIGSQPGSRDPAIAGSTSACP